MLSKKKCIEAINNWDITRTQYPKIKELINPSATFPFSAEDCKWLNDNNENTNFHTYIGDQNNALLLIVVPLDKKGKEIDLEHYLTSTLTPLSGDLNFVEVDVVTTTKKTVLSKDLKIVSYKEEIVYPTYNEPTISERASVNDIELWKNDSLDWLYAECKEFNGQRIFRTFNVPFADLVRDDEVYTEVQAMFGFKFSSIYERQIPVLIFVASNEISGQAGIIRQNNMAQEDQAETNTKDWSCPCPPICRDVFEYNLLG